jgi:uncharacterized lipoprotein YajG
MSTLSKRAICSTSLLALVIGISLLTGCAAPLDKAKYETDILSEPGASIEMGRVSAAEGNVFESDALGMLREAINQELEQRQIRWSGDASRPRFILNATIINYEMGNSFKRWLLPGWGGTILDVKCDLLSDRDGSLVASFQQKRGVYVGGLYTIGAWRTIFSSVAADIANELEARMKGKGFVVSAEPLSAKDVKIEPAAIRQKIKLVPLEDQRPEKGRIGERFAAFGVSMGNVYLSRSVSAFVSDTVSDELLAEGHTIHNAEQDVTVSGSVIRFWLDTKTTPLYWDIVGEIQIRLTSNSAKAGGPSRERLYSVKQVKRTFVWPSQSLFNEVLNACMEELVQKIRSDSVWAPEG